MPRKPTVSVLGEKNAKLHMLSRMLSSCPVHTLTLTFTIKLQICIACSILYALEFVGFLYLIIALLCG